MQTDRADNRGHENLLPEIRLYADSLGGFFERNRRFLRFVDTHQKWLLVHLIATTCSDLEDQPYGGGAAANWICERAAELGIASRNTALAFFNQLAAYGYLEKRTCRSDRRIKLVSLSSGAELVLLDWTRMLTDIAADDRAPSLENAELRGIYRDLAGRLLANGKWISPPLDVQLTQDMRGGWLVMAEVLRHIPIVASGEAWIPAPGISVADMTQRYGLSRSTVYRLLRLSVEAGTMSWEQRPSGPVLLLNLYHLRQFSRWIGRLLDAAESASNERIRHPSTGVFADPATCLPQAERSDLATVAAA